MPIFSKKKIEFNTVDMLPNISVPYQKTCREYLDDVQYSQKTLSMMSQ